ncbi:protein PXR1 [Phialemonium atrogriseum]|uniref:PinX1-related protein 1 n=1 Tax=Phialemonium atrogriseum TaxID=1093897 RepID=A0AAJ0C697_9PEZI|nr:protein PXR1 [Phialemonium atrogriseum]KAK1768426.1 protein PXR1 [Phialemonium atrogriseum]
MGLAAAKTKRKVGADPNNNKWARNTDSFGHKILRAHGWEPGQYLGAKDAPHAKWHTAANSSHIRVVLKEDNLGLGANRNHGDQCTGLDDFQSILGRLNGKTDEALETEQKFRQELKLSFYLERKFGSMRFVKGGWLVGDQVQDTPTVEEEKTPESEDSTTSSDSQASEAEQSDDKTKRSKKRKLEDGATTERNGGRKSKKRRAEDGSETETEKEKRRRERKERKSKKKEDADTTDGGADTEAPSKKRKKGTQDDGREDPATGDSGGVEAGVEQDAKKRSKKEKKPKKKSKSEESSETEKKSSKKRRRKAEDEPASSVDAGDPVRKDTALDSSAATSKAASSSSTPAGSGFSTPTRHLSRQRFIAQKRMAFSDPKALNQIFMIKSES